MPTFDTPEPIAVTIELGVGDIDIVASDRRDTIVDVLPSDSTRESDVARARQTRVDFANGILLVQHPKGWRYWAPWGGQGSIDVHIELPAGSTVHGSAGVAALRCSGRVGECHFRTGAGDVWLERTGPVEIRAGAGDVTVDEIAGTAQVKTAGAVRIGRIDGSAAIKNSNGDTWVDEITGEARLNAANGAITVGVAGASIVAKTANGDVRLHEVVRGPILAQTAFGTVAIGVRDGVPAWLDLETKFGHVQNDLVQAEPPEPGEDPVEIRAHSSMGDIEIHRRSASSTERTQP